MRRSLPAILASCSLLLAAGCSEPHFTEPMTLGGQQVSAEDLERGWELYTLNCYACHGKTGQGDGPAAKGLRPPPRDFTQGQFKFALTYNEDGEIMPPTDAQLMSLVKKGLHGTPMLKWQLADRELTLIIHYIKSLSKAWKEGAPAKAVEVTKDPWGQAKSAEAISQGKLYYHLAYTTENGKISPSAGCATCHPAYASKQELFDMTLKHQGGRRLKDTDFRKDMYGGKLFANPYGPPLLSPDFTFSELRSVSSIEDLYRRLAEGVGGVMPRWQGTLSEEVLWAITHYVWSLKEMKDTPAGDKLRASLEAQPKFEPPAPPPPPEPVPEEGTAEVAGEAAPEAPPAAAPAGN